MAEIHELVEIKQPDEIKKGIIKKAIIDFPVFKSIQEKGITDMFISVFSDVISDFQNTMLILNDEQSINTAQSEVAIENNALPLYSHKIAEGSEVICKISRKLDVIYNNNPDEPTWYNEDIFINENNIASTGSPKNLTFYPILEDFIPGNKNSTFIRFKCTEPGLHTNIKAGEIIEIEGEWSEYVEITNLEPATGGRNTESIEEVKNNYKNARYQLEKGTSKAINELMSSLGFFTKDYNLKEYVSGYGSFNLFIKTDSESIIETLKWVIKSPETGCGISSIIGKAKSIQIDLKIDIEINIKNKLLQNDEININKLVESAIKEYFENIGVGRNLHKSGLEYFIIDRLTLQQYSVLSCDIKFENLEERISQVKKLLVNSDEYLILGNLICNINPDIFDDEILY